jgi:hypothetical protein
MVRLALPSIDRAAGVCAARKIHSVVVMDYQRTQARTPIGAAGLRQAISATAAFSALLALYLMRAIAKRLWHDDVEDAPVRDHYAKDAEPAAAADWETRVPPR